MSNKTKHFLVLSCLALCATAWAESTADNLSRIEAETLILKAQEKQIQVRAQIADRESEIVSKQIASGHASRFAEAPVVRGVEGIGNNLYASLYLENGSSVDVRSGETLSNGMKIVSIRANEVIVENRNKRRMRLAPAVPVAPATAVSAASPAYPVYPGEMVGLPPMAPGAKTVGAAR